MDEKELRIGNLVFSDGDFEGKIESLGSDKASLYEKGGLDNYGYHRLSGIPITKEWLLNFDFEVSEFGYLKNGLMITHGYQYRSMHFLVEINNVHSLQNLYFALTGEELEIL
jgi:hypothetical protein